MSVDREVLNHLEAFGIDQALAVEAAKRYSKVDAAVEWCFGDGQNWTPGSQSQDNAASPAFPLDIDDDDRKYLIDDREVGRPLPDPLSRPTGSSGRAPLADITSWMPQGPPPLPARPQGPPPLPARPQGSSALPVSVDDGDDEDSNDELRRAILLSRQVDDDGTPSGVQGTDVQEGTDVRHERERSLRATAPPPSPDALNGTAPSYFGPSTRDEQGHTQLVPSVLQPPNISSEDADLDRAIQNSIMTASMQSHSAAIFDQRPQPMPRRPGAPLVFLSGSNELTYAANLLQGLWATPQIRNIIQESRLHPAANEYLRTYESLQGLDVLFESSPDSYFDVDDLLGIMLSNQPASQSPPGQHAAAALQTVNALLVAWLLIGMDTPVPLVSGDEKTRSYWQDPLCLMNTRAEVIGESSQLTTMIIEFEHSASLKGRVHAHLAERLWAVPSYQQTVLRLGEVLPVIIRNSHKYGDERHPWQLEETVYLDRYMKENMGWSTQIRAQQSVAKGNVRRLEQQINELTMHNGKNVIPVLKALTKFYQDSPKPEDEMQVEVQAELRAKLESILEATQSRITGLQEKQKAEQEIVDGKLFETDDPSRKQHVYKLRSVLFHDGSNTPGRHLYMYARQADDTWWRIQDYEIRPVEWTEVVADKTGLHMDGGPYMLFYSREGPCPTPAPAALEENKSRVAGSDIEMRDAETVPVDQPHSGDGAAPSSRSVAGAQSEQQNIQEQAQSTEPATGGAAQTEQQEDLIQL